MANHIVSDAKPRRWRRALLATALLATAMQAPAIPPRAAAMPSHAPAGHANATAAERPNIVVILVDDLGWPDVSTYGRATVPTPNIDRIARTGTAFSSGYVAASVCAVSRAGLLTGRMPQRFGFMYNITDDDGAGGGDKGAGLPPSEKTIAERLKPLGYRTAAIGKWHQGAEDRFYPTNRGFDEFFGFLAGETIYVDPKTPGMVTTPTKADKGKPPFTERRLNGRIIEGADRRPVNDFSKYLTDEITDRAVDFIDRSATSRAPFFTYVAYNAPHWPLQVPQAWYDRFPQIKDPARRTYVAMIAAMDAGVGRILDTLEAKGLRQNTLVVFLADNGCPVQFGFCDEGHPWGAGKFTYLEGGIRVPFMMSWPAQLKPHATVDTPVSSLDIMPTILHAAAPSAPLPAGLDGIDLLRTVEHAPKVPRTLVWGQAPVYAARRGSMKYWRSDDWKEAHLYDLESDAWEKADVSASQSTTRKQLDGAIEAWRNTLPTPSWSHGQTRPVTIGGRKTEWVY